MDGRAEQCCERIYAALERRDYRAAAGEIEVLAEISPERAAGLRVSLWIEQGDAEQAYMAWQELHRLQPEDIYTGFLEARILFMQHRYVSARQRARKLLQRPRIAPAYQEKIANLLGQCCRFLGDSREAAQSYLRAFQAADSIPLKALEYSNYLFNLHYLPPEKNAEAKRAAAGFGRIFRDTPVFLHRWREAGQKRLRVGYISPDIRKHVVLCFSYALLCRYNASEMAVYAYSLSAEDEYSRKTAACVDGWRNLQGLDPAEAARIIYEDEIDILVDFSGHTAHNALPIMAYRPAPIQVSGIGFFSSTGLSTVDYFLGDVWLDDEQSAQAFTEKMLILPQSHFCYRPLHYAELPQQTAYERNGYITFGSFNNFSKVNDRVLAVWQQLLERLPKARLLLKASVFDHEEARAYTWERLRRTGMDMKRVECRGVSRDYLPEYGDMDIALDTFPYPGGGTSCDVLYMGVPLITLQGRSHGERFGSSLLHNVGMPELIANSEEDYIRLAVELAENPELLSALHKQLRKMMEVSPLMDEDAYLQHMGKAYRQIWESYCAGQERLDSAGILRQEAGLQAYQKAGERQQALAAADMIRMAKGRNSRVAVRTAMVYLDAGETEHAREMLEDIPQSGEVLYLSAEAAGLDGDYTESNQLCQQALQRKLLPWQQGAVYHRLAENAKRCGRRQEAAGFYLQSSQHKELDNGKAEDYSNYLLNLQYQEQQLADLYKAAVGYGKIFSDIEVYSHRRDRDRHKIRIGYISADFCRHVAACFSQTFFRACDKERFTIYGYSCGEPDAVTVRFAQQADVWRDMRNLSPAEKAACIYQDEIDILVDLSGHTGGNALPVLARRPARVQVSGVGYFATTGLPAVDYFMVDEYTAPAGEEAYFVEKLLHLSHSHFCYTPLEVRDPVCSTAPFRKNGYITFGSMNQWDKVTDDLLQVWAKIMQQVANSRLFLKAGAFDDAVRCVREKERIVQAGIPWNRVELEGYTHDYLAAYARMDIALDSYPYPGGGTTCDALYMGVPVITRIGQSHHSRFGLSLLQNAGLGELAVPDFAAYVERAVSLAGDTELLCLLHENLQGMLKKSPIMNEGDYMRDWEGICQRIAKEMNAME